MLIRSYWTSPEKHGFVSSLPASFCWPSIHGKQLKMNKCKRSEKESWCRKEIIKPHLKQLSNHLRLTFSFWLFYLGLFPFDPLGRNWVWRFLIVFLGAPFCLSCMILGLCFCRSLTGLDLCFQTFGNFFCRSLRGNQSNNLTNIHPASTFQWNPLLIDKRLLGSPVHQPHRPYPEMKLEGDVVLGCGWWC